MVARNRARLFSGTGVVGDDNDLFQPASVRLVPSPAALDDPQPLARRGRNMHPDLIRQHCPPRPGAGRLVKQLLLIGQLADRPTLIEGQAGFLVIDHADVAGLNFPVGRANFPPQNLVPALQVRQSIWHD